MPEARDAGGAWRHPRCDTLRGVVVHPQVSSSRKVRRVVAVTLVAAAIVVTGCGAPVDDSGRPAAVTTTDAATATTGADTDTHPADEASDGPTVPTDPAAPVDELVSSLTVAPERSADTYDRDSFASGWTDPDGVGCNTRIAVLAATSQRPGGPCDTDDGWWVSLYDGYSTPDPAELHVDHVVALAEAWRSGASDWTPHRRRRFHDDPANLLAVTAAMNLSKGDKDPATWQPPNRDGWCEFTEVYIRAKAKWELTVDEAEHRALTNMRREC